jgi:hypothetical protein
MVRIGGHVLGSVAGTVWNSVWVLLLLYGRNRGGDEKTSVFSQVSYPRVSGAEEQKAWARVSFGGSCADSIAQLRPVDQATKSGLETARDVWGYKIAR